eukprot:gene5107-8705_t
MFGVGRFLKNKKSLFKPKFFTTNVTVEKFMNLVDSEFSNVSSEEIFEKTSEIFKEENIQNYPKLKYPILKSLFKCAELKNVKALKVLGFLYSTGEHFGVQDLETSFRYYLAAAELNDPESQYIVGLMYIKGYDFVNESQANEILTKEHDSVSEIDEETNSFVYVDRKTKLKRKYEENKIEEEIKPEGLSSSIAKKKFMQNKRKGVNWLIKSSENQNSKAKLLLSTYYIDGGGGIEPNIFKSLELLEESASLGDVDAIFNLGTVYFNGLKGKIDDKLVEIPQDIAKSLEYFHEAAYKGDASSQYWLGHSYHQGNYVEKDIEKCLVYLNSAVQQNHSGAIFYLALMYLNEDGVEKDESKFEELFQKAIELKHSGALYLMADFFYHKKGGREQNFQKAFEFYEKSAEQGNPDALYCLGTMYFSGRGTKLDQKKAAQIYTQAGTFGSKGALLALADMYLKGIGVEKDEKHANHLLNVVHSKN